LQEEYFLGSAYDLYQVDVEEHVDGMLFKDFASRVFEQFGCLCIGVEFPPELYTHVKAEKSSAAIAANQSKAGSWNRFRETVVESNLCGDSPRDSGRGSEKAPEATAPKGLTSQMSDYCARRPTTDSSSGSSGSSDSTGTPNGIPQMKRTRSSLKREIKKTREDLDSELTTNQHGRNLGPVCMNPINYHIKALKIDENGETRRHPDAIILIALNREMAEEIQASMRDGWLQKDSITEEFDITIGAGVPSTSAILPGGEQGVARISIGGADMSEITLQEEGSADETAGLADASPASTDVLDQNAKLITDRASKLAQFLSQGVERGGTFDQLCKGLANDPAAVASQEWRDVENLFSELRYIVNDIVLSNRDVLTRAYSDSMGTGIFRLADAKRMPLPDTVQNHVIFLGSLSAAPHFLKPLRFYKDGKRLPDLLSPDVVIVCPEHEDHWNNFWPLLSIFGRVWIIHGKGTMQRRAGQGAIPLEMARVKEASVVVVPNGSRMSHTLSGDGETVQTVRNVQELVAGTEWHFSSHTTPKFLVELNVRHNTLYFRNSLQRPRVFASGQAYECQMLDTLLTQIFHSDATVSILEHSIGYWDGNGRYPFEQYEEIAQPGQKARPLESCHIEQRNVPDEFTGQRYEEFFKWALERDAMPVGLYRHSERYNVMEKVHSASR